MEYFKSCVFLRCLNKINQAYLNSLVYQLIQNALASIRISFKFSLFGRLARVEYSISRDFFTTSKIIKIVLNSISNFKDKIAYPFATNSFLFASAQDIKYYFSLKPFKAGGLIVIAMVTTNLVLSIILQRQIILWNWLMYGLLLLIGINGLFCNINWEDIKKTSYFLKRMNNS